jgi:hypothetical protein
MTDNQPHKIEHDYAGDHEETSVESVETCAVDSSGEWTAYTFGCSCCSHWISDWDLSDKDIEESLRAIVKRHLRLAEEYRKSLENFLANPARVTHKPEDR